MSEDLYYSQNGAGSRDGTIGNPWSSSDVNGSAAKWGAGAGKISAGDTLHVVGTVDGLFVQGSGTAGNPITILWEAGAKMSTPASRLIYAGSKSYVTFDGGTDGIIECTDNGTALGNQLAVTGIQTDGSHFFVVKNLNFRNLYVHSSPSDNGPDLSTVGAINFQGSESMVIQNCTFDNICWCIHANGPSTLLTVTGCTFTNYDHGIAISSSSPVLLPPLICTGNHFGTTAIWDTTADIWHHDGIHIFWAIGASMKNGVISGNLFDGDWGVNNTSHIFYEGNQNDPNVAANSTGWVVENNVHVVYSGRKMNNGCAILQGDGMVLANNTYIGAGITNTTGLSIGGASQIFKNNIISGFTTFLNATNFAASGLDTNLYANQVAGGNYPFSYNSVTKSTFALWKTATGQDANSVYSSATFNADGSLVAGNPAIGAGTDMSAYFTTDYNGITRTVPWDMGAYKFGGVILTQRSAVGGGVRFGGAMAIG